MFALTFDLNQVQLFIKSMQVSVRVLFDCGGSQLNQHVPPLTLQFKDEKTMPPYEQICAPALSLNDDDFQGNDVFSFKKNWMKFNLPEANLYT